ncbi:MAG: hypothetical protein ABIE74_03520 [Pseudomonadota bacterium]
MINVTRTTPTIPITTSPSTQNPLQTSTKFSTITDLPSNVFNPTLTRKPNTLFATSTTDATSAIIGDSTEEQPMVNGGNGDGGQGPKEAGNDIGNLLSSAKSSFNRLAHTTPDLEKYVEPALSFLNEWLSQEQYADYQPALQKLITLSENDDEIANELFDSFWRIIPFGTGGRRWRVGIGPNRMNPHMVALTAQGHANYLLKNYNTDEVKKRGVIAVHDVREFKEYYPETGSIRTYRNTIEELCPSVAGITSKDFSEIEARVYAGNGIRFYYATDPRTTPQLSYWVRDLHRILETDVWQASQESRAMAGIVNSSSHNLPDNNGTKFYEEDGAQASPAKAQIIVNAGNAVQTIHRFDGDLKEAIRSGLIVRVKGAALRQMDDAYFNTFLPELAPFLDSSIARSNTEVAFHALNGTGDRNLGEALKRAGFVVPRSRKDMHDGSFPTAFANTPNPEIEKSFDAPIAIGIKRDTEFFNAKRISVVSHPDKRGFTINAKDAYTNIMQDLLVCQIALCTDPDSDRSGLAIKQIEKLNNGDIKIRWLTANDNDEIAIILFRYLLEKYHALGRLKGRKSVAVSTVVSNGLEQSIVEQLAKQYGVDVKFLIHPVGFKHTGEVITNLKNNKREGIVGQMMEKLSILPGSEFFASFEEGEGGLIGANGSVDKDSAPSGVALAMLATEMRLQGRTVYDYLVETYKRFGFSRMSLKPIVMDGAEGFGMTQRIMSYFRDPNLQPTEIAGFRIKLIEDLNQQYPSNIEAEQNDRNILTFLLEDRTLPDGTVIKNAKIIVRPSGTEPKIKLYASVQAGALGVDATNEELNQQIKIVSEVFEQLLNDLLLKAYDASGANYNNVSVPTEENDRRQLNALYMNMPLRQKLGIYFPTRDRVIELAKKLEAREIDLASAQAEIAERLRQLHKTEGVQYIADAFKIHLANSFKAVSSQSTEEPQAFRLQAQIVFGIEKGNAIFDEIVNRGD